MRRRIMGRKSSSNQVIHMRRTALLSALAVGLFAPAAAHAVPDAAPTQQCDGDACSLGQPLSSGVKVTVVVHGPGAVLVKGTNKHNRAYRHRCPAQYMCWFIARRDSWVSVTAVQGRFVGFTGDFPSLLPAYRFKAHEAPTGDPPVIDARFT